jgi:DNA-binding transcriptional ArsR family regulator
MTPPPPSEPFVPAARYQITKLETVRVLADPLRLRLIEAMATQLDHAWSVKELARTLGEPPTKLYYHVNMLEEHGLLIVTASQLVSGILEKRYQLVAASIGVDRALLTAGDTGVDEALHGILTTIFSTAEEDITAAIRAGIASLHADHEGERERILLSKSVDRMTPERAEEFRERLQALMAEFEPPPGDPSRAGRNGAPYGFVVAFYPMAQTPSPKTRRPRARRTSQEPSR